MRPLFTPTLDGNTGIVWQNKDYYTEMSWFKIVTLNQNKVSDMNTLVDSL